MKALIRFLSAAPLLLFATGLGSAPAGAQDRSGPNISDTQATPTPASEASETLVLGYRLADHARATRDTRAMILAARIVDTVTVEERADSGTIDSPAKQGGEAKPVTASHLFAEARIFAAGDQTLLSEIEAAQSEATRGIPGKSIRAVQYVPPQTTWTVKFAARGGEPLVVGARRDSATPVDLKLYDEDGNLVCQDMSHNVTLYCRINPIWSGPFSVQLINHGDAGTGMTLIIP